MSKIKMPIGFQKSEPVTSPCKSEVIERVEPQDGQGIPVTCFIIQTSGLLSAFGRLIKSQIYPAVQTNAKSR